MSARSAFTTSAIVILLLAILVLQMAFSIRQHAQGNDEATHLLAGYRYWQCGDFGVNPEHPPFLKLVAALPVLSMNAHKELPPCASYAAGTGEQAFRWLYANDAEALLFWARMSAGLFLVAMAIVVYFAARSMFGTGTALLALALTVFEPNLLGLGPYVLTDMALACCLFATVYATRSSQSRRACCSVVF